MNSIRIWNKLFNKKYKPKKTYNTYIKGVPANNHTSTSWTTNTSNTTYSTSQSEYPEYVDVKFSCRKCKKILGHDVMSRYDANNDLGPELKKPNGTYEVESDLLCPICHKLKKLKE